MPRHHHHYTPPNIDNIHGPPPGSFDPELESQRQAGQRGLADLLVDIHRQLKRSRRGFHQQRRTAKIGLRQGLSDIHREKKRSLYDVGTQREDVRTTAQRQTEDFGFQLQDLIRNFNTLGGSQQQTAVAQGVGEGGTIAASAAQRASNLAWQRQPIDTGIARTHEDLATALERLTHQAHQVRRESGIQASRLRSGTHRDIHLARIGLHQNIRDLITQRQRAIREEGFNQADLLREEYYSAGRNRPGLFANLGG